MSQTTSNDRAVGCLAFVVVIAISGVLNATLKNNASSLPSGILYPLFSVLAVVSIIGVIVSLVVGTKSGKAVAVICGLLAFWCMGAAGSLIPNNPSTPDSSPAPLTSSPLPPFVADTQEWRSFFDEFSQYLQKNEPDLVVEATWTSGGATVTVTDRWNELSFKQRATKVKQWYEAMNNARRDGIVSTIYVDDNHKGNDALPGSLGNPLASIDNERLMQVSDDEKGWLKNKNWQTQGIDSGWEKSE